MQAITVTMFIKPKRYWFGSHFICWYDNLWQVNRIKSPSKIEKRESLEENPESDFVMVPYLLYEWETGKLLSITEEVSQSVVLGDLNNTYYDNRLGRDDKPLWSGYQRNKMKNPFSGTLPSFTKYPIKNNFYDTKQRSEVFCYMLQLCERKEEANKANKSCSNKQPYVPFVDINIKTFGEGFVLTVLLFDNQEKRLFSCNCIKSVIRLMLKNKKKQIVNVIAHLPNNREFTVFGKKYNNYSNSRFVLDFSFFKDCCRKSVDLFTPVIRSIMFNDLPYYNKGFLPLVRRDFTFDNDPEFMTINKYSSPMFTTWQTFYKDSWTTLNHLLQDFFNIKIVGKMHCNHEEIIKIVLESESYWMQICVRTFVFCSCTHDNKNICLFCTRMICFEEGCGNILDELDENLLSEILHDLIIDQEKKRCMKH